MGVALAAGGLTGAPAAAQQIDSVLNEQAAADRAGVAAQDRIDKLSDETLEMTSKYRQALYDADSLRKYNEHLFEQLKSQRSELTSIQRQLREIETTEREVQPLMQKMVSTLEEFVALDVPFLIEERTKRIATLKDAMSRADVSAAEKYRRILEAYQIEMEYGRTLDAYEGQIGAGESARTVEFVRVGRVTLMYQTLDGNETGYWDAEKKTWVEDDDYEDAVHGALRVAKKLVAPDLLVVPVPAPKEIPS